ncbi:MAG: PhoH family protein [Lachnospiraceae bacterium]|nr:PhoH family protein [Lachnospiraceae bacterium]
MSAAAGALIPIKEKEFSKIDFVQDSILDCLSNYRQVQIVGGAGTGKTFIAIKKAIRDAIGGKRVLFTCCNEELVLFVKSKCSQLSKIDVYTYTELMHTLLGGKYELLPVNSNGNKCCFEWIDEIPLASKYDSIIVDEAQDFDVDMGLTVRSLLMNETDASLYVFYDKNQNVFEMNFENAFAIDALPYVLRYNIRNTGSIYQCAVERTNLGRDTVANSIVGVHPEIHNYTRPSQTLKALSLIVNQLVQKEYVPAASIVIVSDTPYTRSVLAGEQRVGAYNLVFKHCKEAAEDEICFKTVEEFKGLESDVVIYLTHEFTDLAPSVVDNRKEYVAITRARYYLYILNTKCKAAIW